ncbi:putative RNA-binding protein 42 [Paratrimastix pyriformis]|uniref:RNA-binding protein 42 n=1 Tax=Paratrimastix pyriformis TaxID=342808 RepID=A0ABQ8UV97_9EUKA|nr:putative RNA-binding protein 42 [Paratrimastix pyriformis]
MDRERREQVVPEAHQRPYRRPNPVSDYEQWDTEMEGGQQQFFPPPPPPPGPPPMAALMAGGVTSTVPSGARTPPPPPPESAAEHQQFRKMKRTIIRKAADETWEDRTLLEWPENDYRMFCGDLGTEVTDDMLTRAFSKYASFNKAKVVKDNRTHKTKGYGFVSFSDPDDYLKAYKEMHGQYVGSRPIKLKKSKWQERSFYNKKNKNKHII